MDWFYRDQFAGSGSVSSVGGMDGQVTLVNTDQARWLFVYQIAAISGLAFFAYYFTTQTKPTTPLVGSCFPAICDGGTPPAQIYAGNVTPQLGTNKSFPFLQLFSAAGSLNAGGPFAIVKPGYNLVVQCAGDCEASFSGIVQGP